MRLDLEGHPGLSFTDSKGIPRAILAALGLGVNATGLAFYDKDQRLPAIGAPYAATQRSKREAHGEGTVNGFQISDARLLQLEE